MLSVFCTAGTALAAPAVQTFDVAVYGAGTGGCAAAIQAARMGASVALIEPSDWVGGQAVTVSTMDDMTMTRTGLYNEFISRIIELYSGWGTNVNVCYWGSDTIAFEPWAGRKVLLEMLKSAGLVQVMFKTTAVSAKMEKNRVTSAVFESEGKKFTVKAKIFIDASECGDFIPLTGARYRSGNSLSPKIDRDAVIQSITYPTVVKKYQNGLPEELKMQQQPAGYADYLFHFRATIRPNGSSWPGSYPFNVPVHNEYRALPDPSSHLKVDGGVPDTWPNVTRTEINWANDYPGGDRARGLDDVGMSVKFLEDKKFRREAERAAMLKTLCFLYYMQNELGLKDWSVDDRQGFGDWFSDDWRDDPELAAYEPILKHFPPFPYVRESRRIAGVTTLRIEEVVRDEQLRRTLTSRKDSVALGEYPIDVHGSLDPKHLDRDLHESTALLPEKWGGAGLFQIPLGALIPEKVDGLLAAEKNISVSRLVNGATRLHPVTMLTGQAAGAAAALAVKQNVQPRQLRVQDVQAALLAAHDHLSLFSFEDAPEYAKVWSGVEAAILYEYMDPRSDRIFGVDDEMHWIEVRDAFRRAFGLGRPLPARDDLAPLTRAEFGTWLTEYYGKEAGAYQALIDGETEDKPLTKGQLAASVWKAMQVPPADQTVKKKKK